MRRDRVRPARETRSEQVSLPRRRRAGDSIEASVWALKLTRGGSPVELARRQADGACLGKREVAVLWLGKPSDDAFGVSAHPRSTAAGYDTYAPFMFWRPPSTDTVIP